jgi:hypothetical protein
LENSKGLPKLVKYEEAPMSVKKQPIGDFWRKKYELMPRS